MTLTQVQTMNQDLVNENARLKRELKRCMEKVKNEVLTSPEIEES